MVYFCTQDYQWLGRCIAIRTKEILNEKREKYITDMFMLKKDICFMHSRCIYICCMLICMLMCFSDAFGQRASAMEKTDYERLKTKVIQAYKNYKTEVDVSSFELYVDSDKSTIKEIMTEVVNKTTMIFYNNHSYSLEYTGTTGKITKLELGYASEYKKTNGSVKEAAIKKAAAKLNKEINKITSKIKPGMNSVDKALFVHDQIAKDTSYEDKVSNNSRLTEYGVLVKHKGNCQGYSLAYAAVMEKLGFSVHFVDSEYMDHVWNQIKIGSNWYNVDVTWDDSVDSDNGRNQDGVVYHKYFLASDKYMRNHGYSGFDSSGVNSKIYDTAYFKKVTSAFDYRGSYWVFMNNSGIYKRAHISSGKAKCLLKVKGSCFIKFNSNKYYYTAYNRLYIFNYKEKNAKVIWSPVKKYGNSYYITQLKYSSGKIKYVVKNTKKSKVKSGLLKVKKSGMI